MNHYVWSPEECWLLEALAGTVPPSDLAGEYNKRARVEPNMHRRTPEAIDTQLVKMGVSKKPDNCNCFTAEAIAQALGISPLTISRWCNRGMRHTRDAKDRIYVKVKDLCTYLATNPDCLEKSKVSPHTMAFVLACFGTVYDKAREYDTAAKAKAKQKRQAKSEEVAA